jgi:hypothetical protein
MSHAEPIDAAASNLNATVTGADRRTLDAIFRHPLAHNLSWREVVSLVSAIGEADEKPNGDVVLHVGLEHLSMKKPHTKDMTADDVMGLRHFLTRAGWSPDAAAPSPSPIEARSEADAQSLIVVIDHAGAQVYRIDLFADDADGVAAHDPRQLLHHIERKQHDQDRDETYPADERFFEEVAVALASGGHIVVIGHGKGQSNEGDHLTAYLKRHHHETYLRIVGGLVADLHHLTTAQKLHLGRQALLGQALLADQ